MVTIQNLLTFNVSSTSFSEPNNDQKISLAQNLVSNHASVISEIFDISSPISTQTSNNLSELESVYVDLWNEFFVDDLIIEIESINQTCSIFLIGFCTTIIR